jgi:hypothetical protein
MVELAGLKIKQVHSTRSVPNTPWVGMTFKIYLLMLASLKWLGFDHGSCACIDGRVWLRTRRQGRRADRTLRVKDNQRTPSPARCRNVKIQPCPSLLLLSPSSHALTNVRMSLGFRVLYLKQTIFVIQCLNFNVSAITRLRACTSIDANHSLS